MPGYPSMPEMDLNAFSGNNEIMNSELVHRISEVRSRIVHACERANRDPSEIRLLLASKTVAPEIIREAFHAGVNLFGENKAQELNDKYPQLNDLPIEWHFIGNLQSNKVKTVMDKVSLIHSVDRMSLAEEIQKQALHANRTISILIEINSSGEASKGGVSPDHFQEFLDQISGMSQLRIEGLMTMAIDGNEAEIRKCFRITRNLLEKNRPKIKGTILSMGMSGDYEIAVEEGSTLIRIGSGVFGKRI